MMEAVIFMGIQASGKSTLYQQFFRNTHVRINLDMLKTRHRESILVDACIAAKQPFVVDNTNPEPADRQRYIEKLRNKGFHVIGYYFQSNIESCLRRNQLREAAARVPEIGIKSTFIKLLLPKYEEGFSELKYVRLQKGAFVLEPWNHEI